MADYFDRATGTDSMPTYQPAVPLLHELYSESNSNQKLSHARKVVERMLRTGKVEW